MELITTDSILSTALYGVRFAARAFPVMRHVYWWGRDDSRGVFLDRISVEKAQDSISLSLRGLHGHLCQIVTIWTMEFAVCRELTFTPAVGE